MTENLDFESAELLLKIEKQQCLSLDSIAFCDKVTYIYNPLEYAKETHEYFVRKYCNGKKTVLFLGMNPGPFGMAQNGVPFGDSYYVKNWLSVKGNIKKPMKEHPRRQIFGLDCKRSEISGQRFWSFLKDVCKTPEVFFTHCYVHNYCPFSLMTASGKNVTPPELPLLERKALENICDESLFNVLNLLEVKIVVGIGKFAEDRAKRVISSHLLPDITVTGMMHPSPINPSANKGWKDIAYKKLEDNGILYYMKNELP